MKSKNIVAAGQSIKAIKNMASANKRRLNNIVSTKINRVLIKIPIPIENPTKPSLYSFFQGLKYVFTKIGREES